MATRAFELTRLDSATFEHLVNTLALKILGNGVAGFAPGPDGGRDGYFEGEADYPSAQTRWRGTWYIQSKFHAPSLTGDPQKWLQKQVQLEIEEFARADSGRTLPDNWIIATNVDPSGAAGTGTFDKVIGAVKKFNPELGAHTHIWGGTKILDFLVHQPDVAKHYGGFLTSGEVISAILQSLNDVSASINEIIHHLVVNQISEQQFTKLEQAGSSADTRPGIHSLYTDLPFNFENCRYPGVLAELTRTLARNHSPNGFDPVGPDWDRWGRRPQRSRVWFVRGGPGNGKSTLTQFVCQIHRAAIIANFTSPVSAKVEELSKEIKSRAEELGYFPLAARIPVHFELRNYAHWYGQKSASSSRGVLTYLAHRLTREVEQTVHVGTLKRAFAKGRWLFIFDGLDEVPGDVKDELAKEINKFIDEYLLECKSDAMIVCTSRPQGYSGQFDDLRPSIIDLAKLHPEEALKCANPVLAIDRSAEEVEGYRAILRDAISSPSICEIMTTPLQSHIMAVVVRDGGRPPERKWLLFSNFYEVIKKREANRNLADPRVARLLRECDKLIKALHNRLGFELHYRAEKSSGAQTSISRDDLRGIIREVVNSLQDDDIEDTIAILDEATTERLVLVNTPENGGTVRFDIRPLQEFFAAEYIYESAVELNFSERLRAIATDSHWREVMHFLLSALVERERRGELAQAVEVLSDADDSPLDQRRAIARRLSIGGILAAQLLREGVLESDKRTRVLFRKCFTSLLATTDARILFGARPPQHSSTWLVGVSLDVINENSPFENIGAACLFPLLLDDGVYQVDLVISALVGSDNKYIEAFVSHLSPKGFPVQGVDLPGWVYIVLIRRVFSDNWRDLSEKTLEHIYFILGSDVDLFVSSAISIGISPDVARILSACFSRYYYARGGALIEERNIGGMIVERIIEPPVELNGFLWPPEVWEEMEELGGVARICALLAKAALHGDAVAIGCLEEELCGGGGLWRVPEGYRQLFFQIGECQAPGAAIADLFRDSHLGCSVEHTFVSDPNEDSDWYQVAAKFPSICNVILSDSSESPLVTSLHNWLSDKENLDFFVDCLINSMQSGNLGFGDIGVFEIDFPSAMPALKTSIAKYPPVNSRDRLKRYNKPFKLELPADAVLLPHVASCVSPEPDNLFRLGLSERMTFGEAAEMVKIFIPDGYSLRAIWSDEAVEKNIRAAAGALLLSYSDDGVRLKSNEYDIISSFYNDDISYWFVPVVFQFLTPAVRNGKQEALDLVEKILALARTDLRARCACETVIADWREITRAPVHESFDEGIWGA